MGVYHIAWSLSREIDGGMEFDVLLREVLGANTKSDACNFIMDTFGDSEEGQEGWELTGPARVLEQDEKSYDRQRPYFNPEPVNSIKRPSHLRPVED